MKRVGQAKGHSAQNRAWRAERKARRLAALPDQPSKSFVPPWVADPALLPKKPPGR